MSMFWMTVGFFTGFAVGGSFIYALLTWGQESPVPRADVKHEDKGEGEHDLDDWDHFLDDLPAYLRKQAD